jgi:hypothetical protein
MNDTSRGYRFRAFHLLAGLPCIGLLGGLPFVNRVEPFVLGLPFILFWIVAWVVATSVIMGIVWKLDERANQRSEADS